jgi:uncharacterized membrane protein YfcA
MDALLYHFPVSGVETWVWLPPLVMFFVSAFVSMGGVSGAFVLVPFQMSCLGYTSPGVSGTNFVYNIVAIPVGLRHYLRARRISYPLFGILALGTLPGVFLGYGVRLICLPEPEHFIPFVGVVLGALGARTLWSAVRDPRPAPRPADLPGAGRGGTIRAADRVTGGRIGFPRTTVEVSGAPYAFATTPVLGASFVVGILGGAYGIGGGAIMAPFLVSVVRLPVQAVAGAALLSTWVTSLVAAFVYALGPLQGGREASPDWLLGGLFGLGGMAGIYLGARLQSVVPAAVVKATLGVALIAIALRYVLFVAIG